MTRLLIGPNNTAGSGIRLAQALRKAGVDAVSVGRKDECKGTVLVWQADKMLDSRWEGPAWDKYLDGFTHFLCMAGLSLRRRGYWWADDPLPGVTGVLCPGSEFRKPKVHKKLEQWSPYGDDELTHRLIAASHAFHRRLDLVPVPFFVYTAGMLDYRPGGVWVPIIGDPMPQKPLLKRKRPVVFYAPTNSILKGAKYVDALEQNGFDLIHPKKYLTPQEMEKAIASCDILIGGMVLGDYGHTEIQGMAAGRVLISNVGVRTRAHMPEPPPILHVTPDTLAATIADVIENREQAREIAARGPAFVERWHDGRYAVEQLRPFLALDPATWKRPWPPRAYIRPRTPDRFRRSTNLGTPKARRR